MVKTIFKSFLSIFKFSFILVFGVQLSHAQQKKANIVIIISDDHALQAISTYGSNIVKTPVIDKIANEGVRFDKAYVTNSICGPSRAVLLTGKYSHKNGFKDNETSVFNHGQDLFVKRLQEAGYQTAWIGKQHLGDQPEGFDFYSILTGQGEYYNPDFITNGVRERIHGYVTNIVSDKAENWLESRDKDKPFCLVIGHKATHRVWLPDLGDLGMYDNTNFPIPETFYDDYKGRQGAAQQEMSISKDMVLGYDLKMESPENALKQGAVKRMDQQQLAAFNNYYQPIYNDFKAKNLKDNELAEWKYQRYMRDYMATAASLDRNIGKTLDYLDEHQLADNTIVIYLSDQGFYMGEHGWFDKRWMYEESFRTPMVMRYPNVIKPGTVNTDFILNLDIAPTLLDAAGVAIPKDIQGKSFLPLLKDKNIKGRDAIYYHYFENGEHAVSPHFGVKTERYKLMRLYKRVEGWELYDLKKDQHEMNNIYGKKGTEKLTKKLKKKLNDLISQYEDEDAAKIIANEK